MTLSAFSRSAREILPWLSTSIILREPPTLSSYFWSWESILVIMERIFLLRGVVTESDSSGLDLESYDGAKVKNQGVRRKEEGKREDTSANVKQGEWMSEMRATYLLGGDVVAHESLELGSLLDDRRLGGQDRQSLSELGDLRERKERM
jgi:hypothetical protein